MGLLNPDSWFDSTWAGQNNAGVVKLVTTGDLKSPAEWLAGSSPATRTKLGQ